MEIHVVIFLACVGRRTDSEQALAGPSLYALVSFSGSAPKSQIEKPRASENMGPIPSQWSPTRRLEFLRKTAESAMRGEYHDHITYQQGFVVFISNCYVLGFRKLGLSAPIGLCVCHTIFDLVFRKQSLSRKRLPVGDNVVHSWYSFNVPCDLWFNIFKIGQVSYKQSQLSFQESPAS